MQSTTIELRTQREGELSMISMGGTNTYRFEDRDIDSPFMFVMNTVGPDDTDAVLQTTTAKVTITIEYDVA